MSRVLDLWSGMTGTVLPFAGSIAPDGWMFCHGQAVSRADYANLFSKIGTTFGTGDGSATFNLPDLRGEFIRGLDNGKGVDAGRALGVSQSDSFGSHRHTMSLQRSSGAAGSAMPPVNAGNNVLAFNANGMAGDYLSDISSGSAISLSGGNETRPRNIALNHIIKL